MRMIIGVVFLFLVVTFVGTSIRFSSTGEGVHNVFVTAIEKKGLIFPNYRVYIKTDNSSSQEDVYCMDRNKTELAAAIRQYSKNKTRVDVLFQGVRGLGVGLCSDVEIIDVQPTK